METHRLMMTTAEGKIFYSKSSCESRKEALWNMYPLISVDAWQELWKLFLRSCLLYPVILIQYDSCSPNKASRKPPKHSRLLELVSPDTLGSCASFCLFSSSANDLKAVTFLWTLSKCMCTRELGSFPDLPSPLSAALEMRQWVNWCSYLHPGPAKTYLSVVFGLQSK